MTEPWGLSEPVTDAEEPPVLAPFASIRAFAVCCTTACVCFRCVRSWRRCVWVFLRDHSFDCVVEQIQRECNVVITGPTTLAVILNSLQMGFRTLALQQRSSEVWKILGAVKNEFTKFGGLMEKAQKNIQQLILLEGMKKKIRRKSQLPQ